MGFDNDNIKEDFSVMIFKVLRSWIWVAAAAVALLVSANANAFHGGLEGDCELSFIPGLINPDLAISIDLLP